MTDSSNSSNSNPRRIKLPKIEKAAPAAPSLNQLMNDAMNIVGAELAHYKAKTAKGITLDLKEARVVANYIDVLTKASKESREQARANDLSDLSNEELIQLASSLASAKLTPPQSAKLTKPDEDENN